MRTSTIADVMTTNVITATPVTPYRDLARQMSLHRVGMLPIVDADRTVMGVVSETDLIEDGSAGGHGAWWRRRHRRPLRVLARDIMTTPPVCTTPEATLQEAARRMVRNHVTHLPVLDAEARLVGLVARSDLLQVFLADDLQIRRAVEHDVLEHTMLLDPLEFTVDVHDGIVTISGRLERRSLVPMVLQTIRTLDGVVAVRDHLTFGTDDTAGSAFAPRSTYPR